MFAVLFSNRPLYKACLGSPLFSICNRFLLRSARGFASFSSGSSSRRRPSDRRRGFRSRPRDPPGLPRLRPPHPKALPDPGRPPLATGPRRTRRFWRRCSLTFSAALLPPTPARAGLDPLRPSGPLGPSPLTRAPTSEGSPLGWVSLPTCPTCPTWLTWGFGPRT